MIANALFAATAIFMAGAFWILQSCAFLIPYRDVLVHRYGTVILAWSVIGFVNLFAGCYVVTRTLFLKDTGQKLAHLEKQLRSRVTISEELSRRLEE